MASRFFLKRKCSVLAIAESPALMLAVGIELPLNERTYVAERDAGSQTLAHPWVVRRRVLLGLCWDI